METVNSNLKKFYTTLALRDLGGNVVFMWVFPMLLNLNSVSSSIFSMNVSPVVVNTRPTNIDINVKTEMSCSRNEDYTNINREFFLGEFAFCKIRTIDPMAIQLKLLRISINNLEVNPTPSSVLTEQGHELRFNVRMTTVGQHIVLNASSSVAFSSNSVDGNGGRRLLNLEGTRISNSNFYITVSKKPSSNNDDGGNKGGNRKNSLESESIDAGNDVEENNTFGIPTIASISGAVVVLVGVGFFVHKNYTCKSKKTINNNNGNIIVNQNFNSGVGGLEHTSVPPDLQNMPIPSAPFNPSYRAEQQDIENENWG